MKLFFFFGVILLNTGIQEFENVKISSKNLFFSILEVFKGRENRSQMILLGKFLIYQSI